MVGMAVVVLVGFQIVLLALVVEQAQVVELEALVLVMVVSLKEEK
jgi:hypothetical protein